MRMAEREPQAQAGQLVPACSREPQHELEELLFTLQICRRALPWDAHPVHGERLQRIEALVRGSLERG